MCLVIFGYFKGVMIRNLLVLLVFLSVGLGASVAQSDIFLRKSPKKEVSKEESAEKPQKKRSIFLRPFKKDSPKVSNVRSRLQAKLNVDGVRKRIEGDLKVLDYWQKRDTKPQNIEELRSYAFAMRVNQRAELLKGMELERVALANLARKHELEFQKTLAARTPNMEAALAETALIEGRAAKSTNRVYTNFKPASAQSDNKKVRRVYRQREETLQKPTRVYRDYR